MTYEEILIRQNRHWRGEKFPVGIERDIKSEVVRFLDTKYILVVTGVRRSGKSYLLFQLVDILLKKMPSENVLYVNFDDPVFQGLRAEPGGIETLYRDYLKLKNPKGVKYLLFDEIQNVPNWEKWIKAYYDMEEGIKFVVTGSNSTLLSSELSTLLTGRNLQFEVFPFNFREVLKAKDEDIIVSPDPGEIYMRNYGKKDSLRHYLDGVLKWGSFPEVVFLDESQREAVLKEYYKDILYRDIIPRFEVRHANKLEEIAYFVISNISNAVSYHNIGELAGIHENTVREYLNYFEKAYLSFQVAKFSYSLKEQIKNPKKVYFIDTGMRNAVAFRFSQDIGRLCENLVFIDLRRRGKRVYYWKGKGEVDFVVMEGLKVEQLVQVCWDVRDAKTKEREVEGLVEAMGKLEVEESVVVTDDYFGEEEREGRRVRFVPLWCWLGREG
ncbi:MAG: ATP-binding protein [Candidatus Methanoperedens sp.]|nr:ATP-binding protein [Candidatus Methanoperedens sp.]